MGEVFGYIFGTLHHSEVSIRRIDRVLTSQRKLNNWMTIVAIASCINLMLDDIKRKEQQAEIEHLKKEVEELKRMKGE